MTAQRYWHESPQPLGFVAESPNSASLPDNPERVDWNKIWETVVEFCALERRLNDPKTVDPPEIVALSGSARRLRSELKGQLSSPRWCRDPRFDPSNCEWTVTGGGLFVPSRLPFDAAPSAVAKLVEILAEEKVPLYRLVGPNIRWDMPHAHTTITPTSVTVPYAAIVPGFLVRHAGQKASLQASPLSTKELREVGEAALLLRQVPGTTALLARFWWEKREHYPAFPSPVGNLFAPAAHTNDAIVGADDSLHADPLQVNVSRLPIRSRMPCSQDATHLTLQRTREATGL